MPIFLECQRCTECCRWPGQVKVSEPEIADLAAHLGLSDYDFIQQYTRLDADRRGLALTEKPTGECIFLDGRDCRVQPVKPQRCRDFPNLWTYPGAEKICQAIPQRVSAEEYQRLVLAATQRTELPPEVLARLREDHPA